MSAPVTVPRPALVARGLRLTYATISYNAAEAAVAIAAGVAAGSVALVGFGADSMIELTAGAAALWRLHADDDPARRARAERASLRVVGACFLGLALYVAADAGLALARHETPRESDVGIALATLSAVVMPLLARAKRRVALTMGSGALAAEAMQTSLCAWLSVILLAGLALNATLGWWWADPAAALAMVPIIGREGIEGLRGRSGCGDCCG
jgi:divalent metal cation (Fe/Co/Zn/Cd) transporter